MFSSVSCFTWFLNLAKQKMAGLTNQESMQQDLISSFLEIGEGQTSHTARQFLEATRWDLEEAIQLFFVSNVEGTREQAPSLSAQPPRQMETEDVSNSPRDCPNAWESEKDEDDDNDDMVCEASSDEDQLPEEIENHSENNAGQNLESLYNPPFELMFRGPFEKAKDAAKLQNKWLLVNLQRTGEFSSFLLNRDTWRNKAVVETVETNFIFWQAVENSVEGQKVRTYYKLELELLPVVMVIEPITGRKINTMAGMVEPENLLYNLLDCTDCGPLDYCINLFGKHVNSSRVLQDQENKKEEDEDVLRALTHSMEGVKLDDDVKKPGYPPLPEEPKVDDMKLICKVGVRLPDGRRIQRSFLRSDPIQLLWSFCCSKLEEAEKRPFCLAFATPGSSRCLEYGSNSSFEESGLINCMLLFTWD